MWKQISSAVVVLSLVGCTNTALNGMNQGMDQAMGQPVSQVQDALGEAVEMTTEGGQTKYRWFAESHIEPCQVEVWADADGIVRRTAWSGYEIACREFADGLTRVFPAP